MKFHIPDVKILSTNHCGDYFRTAFKRRESFQDVLCHHAYADRVVGISPHEIQTEYNGGNRSVYIEGIALEHFSALTETGITSSKRMCPHHAVFHSFPPDDSK